MAKSIVLFILVNTAMLQVFATSWTSKEKQRKFEIETVKKGKVVDWVKVTDKCKDEHPGCKEFVERCSLRIVQKKCKETCGRCRAQAPPDCKLTEYGCCWDNVTIATGRFNEGCSDCSDKFSECKYFAKDCSRRDIKLICPVTCGVKCEQCADNRHQAVVCPLYKKYRFCEISPDLMSKMCSKTCGFCPS